MRTATVLAATLMLASAAGRTETLMNDTGGEAYGLVVVFQEPVTITSFDEMLPLVQPGGESTEFRFSGAVLQGGTDFTFAWEPSSVALTNHYWLNLPEGLFDVVYGYLQTPRSCHTTSHVVPVYISVPPETPFGVQFTLSVDGDQALELHRADETDVIGAIAVQQVPIELELSIFADGEEVVANKSVSLENGFQSVMLAIKDLPNVETDASFPPGFHRGACVFDVWGGYVCGIDREPELVDNLDYFEGVCHRLAEDGVKDVYVTSHIEYVSIYPEPQLRLWLNGITINEEDLSTLVEIAHSHGLAFHLMYSAYWDEPGEPGVLWLWQAEKSETWIRSLFEEYEPLIVEEARRAQAAGVDHFAVNWQHWLVSYVGQESLWADSWKRIISAVKQEFSGELQYFLLAHADVENIVQGLTPVSDFEEIDSFIFKQLVPYHGFQTYDDSIPTARNGFEEMIAWLEEFTDMVSQPLFLEVAYQSTDGYLVDGWFDVAVGVVGNTVPDFLEQARLYEGLFQAILLSDIVDGVITYKYHWDDPFCADLAVPAVARMDLAASVRNKPAEAVLKRWFGGTLSPGSDLSTSTLRAMNRPWCQEAPRRVGGRRR